MNKAWWKVLTGLLIMLFSTAVVQAQTFPLPASSSEPPAICTGCRGSNWFGVANDGLPTFPYSSPIKDHTGRYVDSINTKDFQTSRTARAARIRPCAGQNRLYVQLGATLAAYKLDTFFTQKLPAGTVPVDIMSTGLPYGREGFPLEEVSAPDAFVYPEATNQGWEYANVDGQERLYDFDCDDRGYVYAAYSILGWGIVQDDGRTGTKALPLVWQVLGSNKPRGYDKLDLISPTTILSLKVVRSSGTKYYAVVSSQSKSSRAEVWDVSASPPKNLIAPVVLNDNQFGKGIKQWAKNADGSRFAYIDGSLRLQIYDGATFVDGGNALYTESNRTFVSVASDGTNFWAVDSNGNLSGNKLWKFMPAGNTYAATSFDLGTLNPQIMGAGGGYLAIAGFAPGINVGTANDVVLYKIDGAQPEKIDLKNFFRNYYGSPPTAQYARPGEYASTLRGVQPFKQNGRLFLMYSMHGLGDVYEIQAGDSVTADSFENAYGTANPNNPTRLTALGPFPGDPITFTSATSSAFALNVNWTFDNPELGAADVAVPKRTGETITYQWGALATTTQIARPRTVTVKGNSDPTMSDAVTITHVVPAARVGIAASPTTLITAATSVAPQLLVGDLFTDASEGSIEGHFSNFTLSPDAVNVNKKPNGTVPVGQCGDHVLTFNAHYGPYNEATFTPANASHYVASIPNISYGVRPFTIALGGSTISGNSVIFNGSGRSSTDPAAFAATPPSQWTVTWTLKNASGSDIVAPQVSTVAIGTVPTFTVTNRSLIVAGSVLALRGEVPTGSLSTGCASRNVVTDSTQLNPPVPQINRNGCDNVGSPCTFTATAGSGDTSGWTFAWRLRNTGTNTVVATGAANPFTPNISAAGNYKAELDVTKTIFVVPTETASFPVAAALCGTLPTGRNMGIQFYCPAAGCLPGQPINFIASPLGYTIQACDNISWSFGDNAGTASGPDVTHTYGNSGTFTATMTFTNSSSPTPVSFTKTVTIGTVAPSCNAPQPATFTFSGTKGCGPTKACTTAETITFFPSANLQNCDSLRWTFDGVASTETFPQKLYSTPGNRTVSLTVRNQIGESTPYTLTVQVVQDNSQNGGCTIAPKANGISILFTGPQSNCSRANPNCSKSEVIAFDASASFSYAFQACDKFEWNFDDGTSLVTTKAAPHQFAGTKGIYHVTLRVYNEAGSATVSYDMNFGVPLDPAPVLAFDIAPTTGSINNNIAFKASSNLATTTNWTWTFGDGAGDPQGGTVASSSTTTHKYTQPGPYVVTVKAKNGTSPEAQLTHTITINATPQVKYLLPVVTHAKGAGSSVWRTDLQIFQNNTSGSNPLSFKVDFISNKQTYPQKTLSVTQSTYIHQDFVSFFTNADDSGSMILTLDTNVLPTIWTRIYNVSEGGTFGQYIPAILLSDGTSATGITSPLSDGPTNFYLPGLRVPSAASGRFRTNVGFVNVTTAAITLTIKAFDNTGLLLGTFSRTVFPFQLDQFNIASQLPSTPTKAFSLQIESPTGSGLLAYASILDNASNDPAYISAVAEDDVKHNDFRNIIVPGVGHLASGWRSDVSIFNPNSSTMSFNLTYFNQAGQSVATASNIPLSGKGTLQLDDLLREGTLQPVPTDGFGMLRVDTVVSEGFPTVASRTYFDKGEAGSYGQGIGGFALNRANVKPGKPGYIPAVRSDENYYTNIGLVNLSTQTTKVRVTLLQRDTGVAVNAIDFDLAPNQTIIRSPSDGKDLLRALDPSADRGSFKIEIVSGGNVWAFASMINGSKLGDPNVGSKDPEYVAAIATP